jgi:SAM-dependent methyltransferase
MDWRAKALAQNVLARIPFGERLNSLLQIKAGGLRDFDAHVAGKVKDWIGVMSLLAECGVRVDDAAMLEIGTGWFPTLPLCFWLAGAKSCATYDLSRHLSAELTRHLVGSLTTHLDAIAQAASAASSRVRDRFDLLARDDRKTAKEILAIANINYMAPGDAAQTGLPGGCMDIVFSNSVLEHVSPEALPAIMRETRRILRPTGVAVHCVACNDHYAHFDRSISYINYLRYSAREWQRWNNRLQYQNRLRTSDFLRAAEECGLDVIAAQRHVRAGVEPALQVLPIAAEFRKYSHEDLATTTVNFVCRPHAL